jgi:hypothetical protein
MLAPRISFERRRARWRNGWSWIVGSVHAWSARRSVAVPMLLADYLIRLRIRAGEGDRFANRKVIVSLVSAVFIWHCGYRTRRIKATPDMMKKSRLMLAAGPILAFSTLGLAADCYETDATSACKAIVIPAGDYEYLRRELVTIPGEYRNIASSTNTVMTIRTLSGKAMCEEVAYTQGVRDFWVSGDGRFFGFHSYQVEADGHYVFDRAGTGTKLSTGTRPVFSGDASMFAAVQQSGAGWGNLEGLSIWKIRPRGTTVLFEMTETLPKGSEWKIDRWLTNSEIHLSMKSDAAVNAAMQGTFGSYEERIEQVEPERYRLFNDGSGWKLESIIPGQGASLLFDEVHKK